MPRKEPEKHSKKLRKKDVEMVVDALDVPILQ